MAYYNLSGEESAEESDEESDREEDLSVANEEQAPLWDRVIVHLDVDCFYCQCEEVVGPPEYRERPIAIGQKHIIVTSNYIARQQGVKKLQSRDAAYIACPNLLILEGSDLEEYRKHSRKIYVAFRDGFKKLAKEVNVEVQVKKAGMDENFADITDLVKASRLRPRSPNAFIYGDDRSAKSSITEDQSGAEVMVQHELHIASADNVHVNFPEAEQRACEERLHTAAALCAQVRQEVRLKTGFTTTIGVSVSRMLAKLTSDLKKPDSLNILYPWRSGSVIVPMPLRKIPELGHGTFRLLKECLKTYHTRDPKCWTCSDLLRVPIQQVKIALRNIKPTVDGSDEHCAMLLDKCRGLDRTPIEDDCGGLTKQVSVEDSFRRGTMLTKEAVWRAIEELFFRLPKLLEERRTASPTPSQAYPTTIRLTARVVDPTLKNVRRRPFRTQSRQCSFDGKVYMSSDGPTRKNMLRVIIAPLLKALVLENPETPKINVTRMNIAATNFQDLVLAGSFAPGSIQSFVNQNVKLSQSQYQSISPPQTKKRERDEPTRSEESRKLEAGQLDLSVLAELPPDVAAEVKQMYQQQEKKPKKRQTIDSFFHRK
jgi:DNA polymerase iota